MALRNQPYIPLYVQDFLTDEKLRECSAESVGVYIFIMCVMHKSEEYGTITLTHKYDLLKQNSSTTLTFATMLAKHLPFTVNTIDKALIELLQEKVLLIDGNSIVQKRMVKDCKLSVIRAKAGGKGGNKRVENCLSKNQANSQAKDQASTEYESEYEIEVETEDENSSFQANQKDSKPIIRDIPFNEIVELYNETCTKLNKVSKLNNKRKTTLRAWWIDDDLTLDFLKDYFTSVNQSDFLTGNTKGNDWKASFDWLINPSNRIKVLEGNYKNKNSKPEPRKQPITFIEVDQLDYQKNFEKYYKP